MLVADARRVGRHDAQRWCQQLVLKAGAGLHWGHCSRQAQRCSTTFGMLGTHGNRLPLATLRQAPYRAWTWRQGQLKRRQLKEAQRSQSQHRGFDRKGKCTPVRACFASICFLLPSSPAGSKWLRLAGSGRQS